MWLGFLLLEQMSEGSSRTLTQICWSGGTRYVPEPDSGFHLHFTLPTHFLSQAGSFYPFFRAHAHVDTRRREPWLFDPDKMAMMRDALRMRYELLPLWYTTFYETSVTGLPVLR